VLVSDLSHFLDLPDDAPTPARRLADQLSLIVRAATAGDAGVRWVSALTCRRRPARRACSGNIALKRVDIPPSIEWQCTACNDEGVISGWERTPFDLRPRRGEPAPGATHQVVISAATAAALRTLVLFDTISERIVFRAQVIDGVIVATGDGDDFDELAGYVAAEANHEENRRRQKQLDAAFQELQAVSEGFGEQ
jgi:hypothetical protein